MKIITTLFIFAVCCAAVQAEDHQVPVFQGTDLKQQIQHHTEASPLKPFSWQEIIQKANLSQVQLSPDGMYLIYLLKEQQGVSLWLKNNATGHQEQLLHSLILRSIRWSQNGELIYLSGDNSLSYIRLNDQPRRPELILKYNHDLDEELYNTEAGLPEHVLIIRHTKERGKNRTYQLVRVGIDGQQSVLFEHEKRIYDHLFDGAGNLTFVRYAGEEQHQIVKLDEPEPRIVFRTSVIDMAEMVGFDAATNELILVAYHDADLRSLHAVNIVTGDSKVLHQDPEQLADISSVRIDTQSGEVLLVSYYTDRLKTYAYAPSMAAGLATINNSLKESLTIHANKSSPYWLVRQGGSTIGHPQYHLYDVYNDQLKTILTAERNKTPLLSAAQLAKALPISYPASDGRVIHGYVMLPKGTDLSTVPLITHVHGGPFNRWHGGYTPWQYLVNQGYAVFLPNFRASKGYGLDYMTAGKAQFSTRVQQDIIDGIKYLLAQGISQPDLQGVFGHSFGGFSVLALLSAYPDFFQAGFASAAPTELLNAIIKLDQKDINRYDGIPLLKALPILMVDLDDEQQQKRMSENAPQALWQNITSPLFIWAGAKDLRVPIIDVKDHATKLKNAGKSIQLLVDENTGHNFSRNDLVGRQAFQLLVEDFFAQQFNKPRPKLDANTQDYIDKFKVY